METFGSVERWITRLSTEYSDSPDTRRNYMRWLRRFSDFAGMNPDQLVEARKQDLAEADEAAKRRMEEKLTAFFSRLEKKEGLKRNTAVHAHAAIRSFFRANYLPLKLSAPQTWTEKVYKVPTREELRAMCDLAKPQVKAYMLCQAQSGLSERDLLKLEYSQIRRQLEAGEHPLYLKLQRQKTRGWFETFLGRDACDALNALNLPQQSRVFTLSGRTMRRRVTDLAAKVGVTSEDGVVSPHCLRKFFNTMMKLAGVNETVAEYMMGHSVGKLRSAYFIPPKEELKKVYLKAEPHLTVYP